MFSRLRGARFNRLAVIIPLLVSLAVPLFPSLTRDTKAAAFSIRTGYYIGTGGAKTISGLGFQPQFILLKPNGNANAGIIKTKDMAGGVQNTASASIEGATGITITSDGFALDNTTRTNNTGDLYTYVAIGGSDCTSSGTVCIGTYNGDGTGARAITTGFQPSLVIEKSNKAVGGHFKTATMPSANTEYLLSTAADTASNFIGALSSTGFSVGTQDNLSSSVYYYIAFKAGASIMAEGSYVGNGVDNRDITDPGFRPNMVVVKNSSSATVSNRRPMWTSPDHYGDLSSGIGDGITSAVNVIQGLSSTGFQVGTAAIANENGATIYWFALGGDTSSPTGSGTFKLAKGMYTGTGSAQSVTGLAFTPDLVIIKDDSTGESIFRTSMMIGDATTYIGATTADFTGGVTSLNSDGFSIGTAAVGNTNGNTYRWQAFGNAYNPYTRSGAADFAVGSFIGNGTDNRNITGQPFQPDLVVVKRVQNGGSTVYRTSSMVGDISGFLSGATAESSNQIQSLNSDGFQVGNNNFSNSNTVFNRWFAFKAGTNLSVGSYTGDGVVDKAITAPSFQPDLVWIKQTSTQVGVQRSGVLSGDTSQYFTAAANASGKIKSLTSTGFTLGTGAEVNTNAATYRYVAWRDPPTGSLGVNVVDGGGTTVASPSFSMNASGFQFDCTSSGGSLGDSTQRIRVTNTTTSPAWSLTIAATGGATSLWGNGGNTQQYDFNDTTTSGCADGGDADSVAGRMTIDASAGTLTPQGGCSSSNVSKGSSSAFEQATTDSITILSASASAQTGCYWELTDVTLGQTIPAQQINDSYTLNFTVTITAS